MKCFHLMLRLLQFHSGGECFADGFSVDLPGHPESGRVFGLAGSTMSVRFFFGMSPP